MSVNYNRGIHPLACISEEDYNNATTYYKSYYNWGYTTDYIQDQTTFTIDKGGLDVTQSIEGHSISRGDDTMGEGEM